MNIKKQTFLLSLLALTLIAMSGAKTDAANGPAVGKKAPEFSAIDSNGKKHNLSDFKGKYVVLEWLNHGCPYVKKHYESGNMQKLQKQMTDKGVVWLSIVSSAPGKQGHMTAAEANASLKEKKAAPTAILLDETGDVGMKYAAKTTPHMFLIKLDGTIGYMGAIDDKRSTDIADVKGANNYVMAAFGALSGGKTVDNTQTKPYGCSVKYP